MAQIIEMVRVSGNQWAPRQSRLRSCLRAAIVVSLKMLAGFLGGAAIGLTTALLLGYPIY